MQAQNSDDTVGDKPIAVYYKDATGSHESCHYVYLRTRSSGGSILAAFQERSLSYFVDAARDAAQRPGPRRASLLKPTPDSLP